MHAALMCLMWGGCVGWAHAPEPPEFSCISKAYPKHVCDWVGGVMVWCDGTLMPWDDTHEHSDYEDYLDHASLRDQMAAPYYVLGSRYEHPEVREDPGRARSESFFKHMYGPRASAVKATLAEVPWMRKQGGRTIRMTQINGVDEKLRAVSQELLALDKEVWSKVVQDSGTFVWRKIKRTERLSMHSFGIAVDVGVPISDYWRWNKPDAQGHYAYKNRMPLEVVEVFERHGFIWGGKWYHFDTMHFEYRPEIIACAGTAGM